MQILTNDEMLSLLFKFSQGFDETNIGKSHFEEWLLDNRIWTDRSQIPTTAPALNDGETSGVVTKRVDLILTQVPGNPRAYYHSYLKDAIHFKHGDGTFDWIVKNSNGVELKKGAYRWIKTPGSQVLYFYEGVPSDMPPMVTFFQYSGSKDEFGGEGSGGNADEKFRGNYDPTSGTLPQNGSGPSGAIRKGDYWRISNSGELVDLEPESNLSHGDLLFAGINEPVEIDGYFAVSVNLDATNLVKKDDPLLPNQDESDAMEASLDPGATNEFMTKTAVLQEMLQLGQFVGDHDASTGLVPTTGSGLSGAIRKGDYWRVSPAGTIAGLQPEEVLEGGDVIHAKINDATAVADFFSTQANADLTKKADITDPRFPTTEEKAGLDAANSPSATNPVATVDDLIGGADPVLTKEIVSTQNAFGIAKDDVFPIGTPLEDIWEQMLAVYLAPVFTSYSVLLNPVASYYEVGQTLDVTSASYTANNDSEGNPPQDMLLNGPGFGFAPTGPTTPATPATTVQKITNEGQAWSITGDDKDSNPIPTSNFSRNWRFRHFFGADSTILTGASTPAEVKAVLDVLQDPALAASRARAVTCGAYNDITGNYTYIAYAAKFGDLTSIIQDGSLPVLGAFTKLGDINYQNSYGVIESYSIYKSNADKAFADGTELVIS